MDYKSITAGELSSLLDVQRSNISHILNGRNKPGASFIEKLLLNFPDLNARWLLTGDGEMLENALTTETELVSQTESATDKKEYNKQTNDSIIANKVAMDSNRAIDKVVLLYSDCSFSDYTKKKL